MSCQFLVLKNHSDAAIRRASLLDALRKALNLPHLTVEYDAKGKPSLVGSPLFISVTTTGAVMVCAVSAHPVGLDGEHIERFCEGKIPDYLAIAKRFFTKNEYDYIKKDPKTRFIEVWVRKEAYVKLTGNGVIEFPRFEVSDGETLQSTVKGATISAVFPQFDGNEDYRFAVAERMTDFGIRITEAK